MKKRYGRTFDFDPIKAILLEKIEEKGWKEDFVLVDSFDGVLLNFKNTTEVEIIEFDDRIRFSFIKEGTGFYDHDILRTKPGHEIEIKGYAESAFHKVIDAYFRQSLHYYNGDRRTRLDWMKLRGEFN